MTIDERITELKKLISKVELPWSFDANVPFYVDVKRPRDSLSKHNDKCVTLWHYNDGLYLAMAVNSIRPLIEEIERLRKNV